MTMTPRRHLTLAVVFAVVVPAASWIWSSGGLAYRMYARSASYRIRISGWDDLGRVQPLPPTALATRVRGAGRPYLAGADHWRNLPRAEFVFEHAGELAKLGCDTAPLARRVRVDVDLRRTFDGPVETTSAAAACR